MPSDPRSERESIAGTNPSRDCAAGYGPSGLTGAVGWVSLGRGRTSPLLGTSSGPRNTRDIAEAERKASERPERAIVLATAACSRGMGFFATGDRDSLPAGSVGIGSYALSSLNRARKRRSASTGSSGSVISNEGRVSRMTSTGSEPSSEMSFDPQHGVVGLRHTGRLVWRESEPHRDCPL